MFWNERMETLKGKDLGVLQLRRLKWTVKQAGKVPFYRNRLRVSQNRSGRDQDGLHIWHDNYSWRSSIPQPARRSAPGRRGRW